MPRAARTTAAARKLERDHHAFAERKPPNGIAESDYLAHALVTERERRIHGKEPASEEEVDIASSHCQRANERRVIRR
jgi:hypothetical protein